MRRSIHKAAVLAIVLTTVGCSSLQTQPLQQATDASGATAIKSIEFSGTGRWYQFGQAPNPDAAWPPFDVKNYSADINYDKASAKVQIVRSQVVEPGRLRPAPVEQRVEQYLNGTLAWNVNSAANASPTPSAQPAAVEERAAEIWSTPQGFLKAALANQATSTESADGTEVAFTVAGKYRYVGTLNDQHQLTRVQTWIDNPVLGDTLLETQYSDYKDFAGVSFPGHIVRSQGGYPVLDLNVSAVKVNPVVDITVPPQAVKPTPVNVSAKELAKGVLYLTGGTHHSVAIEQQDHLVVVEAPQNEARSLAVIADLKQRFPNKPIKYLINTHAHFDHAGGLRTYVDAGAKIVTLPANQAYFEKVWANPRTLNPDRLAVSNKSAQFESFVDKHVLSDGKRAIEIHAIAGSGHNDAFVLVYLPKEKILVEADAYTPPAANAPAPTSVNPYSVNLYENIQNLHLDVEQIAALHGPKVAKLTDLRAVIGLEKASLR
ncbi:MAG: MBL fold metallo-hydrolase [Methylococcales bacterium]